MISRFWLVGLVCFSAAIPMAGGQAPNASNRNSTEKIRPTPSALAAKVGSAVNWAGSFEKAQQKSAETGKPIFWYVPTIENSFMDRKVEIDRYMRAGMFSWPTIIERLNEDFIPLRAVPQRAQSREFNLVPFKFVEPGFLVIDQTGKTTLRCDRLTTQNPVWIEGVLDLVSKRQRQQQVNVQQYELLDRAWTLFRNANYSECLRSLDFLTLKSNIGPREWIEPDLLRGMCHFRLGDHAKAKEVWLSFVGRFPNEPLAQKAVAEAEGLGPFVRGFEVHRPLPAAIHDQIDRSSVTSTAAPGIYSQDELWQRGTEFLLGMQRSDGGFVDCDYDFGGTDSLPNVHVAITSICGMALLESDARNVKIEQRQRHNAAELARAFVLDDSHWNFNDSDELFWAHAYRTLFLVRSIQSGWNETAQLQKSVDELQAIQLPSGSWYHEYPNPLVTSLAMVVLKEAQQAGAKINPDVIARALKSLLRNRGRGGFFYSDVTGVPLQAKQQDLTDASAGKLPLCELALHRWGASTEVQLSNAIATSFKKQSHLLAALKYDDHTSRHAYGGFFFWFDLHGRSKAVSELSESTLRTSYQRQIRDLVMKLPEIDGCFVDSHEIGRCYGTAMALLTLANTDEDQ